jgi:hypothetical protein
MFILNLLDGKIEQPYRERKSRHKAKDMRLTPEKSAKCHHREEREYEDHDETVQDDIGLHRRVRTIGKGQSESDGVDR